MGLIWNRKQIDIPKPSKEELVSMVEAMCERGLHGAIESSIQKTIDSSAYFQNFEDDQGNYFGSEFNIRATAGRIKSTYGKEPWVFATATLLAKALSTIPYKVWDKRTDEELPDHPLNAQIGLSNHLQDNKTIEWNGALDLTLGGNFFRVFNEDYTKMMQVPVERVSLDIDEETGRVISIRIWDEIRALWGQVIPSEQVIHHKFPNPSNPYNGMSLFTAASRPIILDRFKNEFEMAFYLRGATNSGVIETTEDISKTRMERLMRTFEQVYTGKRNWWRTIFLPKGAKWVQSGLTMTEMQHLEGLRENRLVILAVLGIPPSQVGIVQDVNRSTGTTQDKHYWQNTIKPLSEFMAAGWNNSYLVKTVYQDLVEIRPDFSGISAMQGTLKEKGEEAQTVKDFLWIDEIRKDVLGYEELPDGAGLMFASEVTGSEDPLALGSLPAGPSGDVDPDIDSDVITTTPSISLNGAQIASLLEIIEQVSTGKLPIEAAINIIRVSFSLSEEDAAAMLEGVQPGSVTPEDEGGGDPVAEVVDETSALDFVGALKASAVNNQERIEKKISTQFIKGYNKYVEAMLDVAVTALNNDKDVEQELEDNQRSLAELYLDEQEDILVLALERGLSFATSQSKSMTWSYKSKNFARISIKRFTTTDQQAVDALRDVQSDGQRTVLLERAINNFVGFNETDSKRIVEIVAGRADKGETNEQIAAGLRAQYDETYKDQAFTIARTETLSAVSQGIKWNDDILGEIFSETQKQWFHVGDVGRNPDARENHQGYEDEGAVAKDYSWGGMLEYPRDPSAPAGETINCRCSMVTVIPDDATSNADAILDGLL